MSIVVLASVHRISIFVPLTWVQSYQAFSVLKLMKQAEIVQIVPAYSLSLFEALSLLRANLGVFSTLTSGETIISRTSKMETCCAGQTGRRSGCS